MAGEVEQGLASGGQGGFGGGPGPDRGFHDSSFQNCVPLCAAEPEDTSGEQHRLPDRIGTIERM